MQHLDIIRIHNASFYAYHGVEQDEQNLGGKFEVDVELGCDVTNAALEDSLKKTVNYEQVYALIHQVVTGKKYFLIEALAHQIAAEVLGTFLIVQYIIVKIRKPHPPVKGVVDYVEVEIKRAR